MTSTMTDGDEYLVDANDDEDEDGDNDHDDCQKRINILIRIMTLT